MHKQHSLTLVSKPRLLLALAACTLALAACGGGGGGGGDDEAGATAPPPASLVDPSLAMRGFWSGALGTAVDGATRSSATVMPDGTAWVVFEGDTAPTGVAKIALTGTGLNETDARVAGTGDYYRSGTAINRNAATANGTASTKGTFTGTLNVAGNVASTFNWTSVAGFASPAVAADLAGRWNGSRTNSDFPAGWVIDSAGAVSGTTLGCTYTGTATPTAGTAVYGVTVVEDCSSSDRGVRTMSGIGILASTSTFTANKNALRVVFTIDGGASAGVFTFTRQ